MVMKSLEVLSYVSMEKNSSVTILSMSKSCANRGLNCVLQLFVITKMQKMPMPSETTLVFRILLSNNNKQTNKQTNKLFGYFLLHSHSNKT